MDALKETVSALRSEDRVILATIVATSGSTPASAFAKMLVKDRGAVSLGTVGGGCVEGDVLREARRLYETGRAAVMTFHLTEDHLESGMLCGGSLDVLIEPIAAAQVPLFERLIAARDDGEDCVLATVLGADGVVRSKELLRLSGEGSGQEVAGLERLKPSLGNDIMSIADGARSVFQRLATRRVPLPDGEVILEPIAGAPGLFIFGGGHVSRYVSRAAAMAGFRVTVVDDRPEFANPLRFPEAAQTVVVEFASAFKEMTVRGSSYVVIVTRGHRSDEEVLEQAIRTPARYIGMIGSRTKVGQTFRNLQERGVSPAALRSVHAPIGVDIGASTAEEIGISIVAELIHARRGEGQPLRSKSDVMKEDRSSTP